MGIEQLNVEIYKTTSHNCMVKMQNNSSQLSIIY